MLAVVLRREGHRVVEIADGQKLRAEISTIGVDAAGARATEILVISDLRLPGADSLSVIRSAWGDKQLHRAPPFILITGFGSERVHAEARALGALAVFDKPFDFEDLLQVVRETLHQRPPS